nr:MAG TPA: hypothetical protein [Caudoviricetes sp.]
MDLTNFFYGRSKFKNSLQFVIFYLIILFAKGLLFMMN